MIVVKIGGAAGISHDALCADAAALIARGLRLVLVHGGSDATTTLARQLAHEPQFITSPSGHTSRRTDPRTLEIFQMACRGIVNQSLVLALVRQGVRAVGISGVDASLWRGTRKAAIRAIVDGRTRLIRDDYSGTVDHVDPTLINTLLDAGFTPVISPPALSEAREPINVDADRAAARTAAALDAENLLLLSNIPGLLRAFPDESSLIQSVPIERLDEAESLAQGRMKNKVLAAREALLAGVRRVVIGDARADTPISRAFEGAGTVFA
ncbi:MAG: [LysW]-aminoadipate kinase [Phycisphaerae bacterium]|nr:[LysW]-aminoadipate kinase [Phycisphaerae bacterium]